MSGLNKLINECPKHISLVFYEEISILDIGDLSDQIMGRNTQGDWGGVLSEASLYLISGILAGIGFRIGLILLGISFPSVNQITSQISNIILIWSDIVSINSPRNYALNTVILVMIMSAVLTSLNRKSPSPTISGILTAPGIEFWSRQVSKSLDLPVIGDFVAGLGRALRFYFWLISIILYFLYPATRILNSDASLLVVTLSAILASVTFGTVFGKLDKGLVLSIKDVSKDVRYRSSRSWSNRWKIYWALMLPVSLFVATSTAYLNYSFLQDPTLGELVSSLSSVFITTSLSMMAVFYLVATFLTFISSCSGAYSSYQDGNWTIQEAIRERWETYINEEFSKGKRDEDMNGYPEEVADALRADNKK